MSDSKEIIGAYEFRSIGDDPAVDVQIDQWLQQYSDVSVVDVKYQVVPFVEGDTLNFASFALVLYHQPEAPEINTAATQRMQMSPHAAKRQQG